MREELALLASINTRLAELEEALARLREELFPLPTYEQATSVEVITEPHWPRLS